MLHLNVQKQKCATIIKKIVPFCTLVSSKPIILFKKILYLFLTFRSPKSAVLVFYEPNGLQNKCLIITNQQFILK